MFEAALSGATDSEITGVDVVRKPALSATATDVLAADAFLLGTPANLGYMSGALKHFFDTIYYPCLDATTNRPFGYYLHGNEGVEGARASIGTVTTGLGWREAAAPVIVMGAPDKDALSTCWELGATLAAGLMP
ncbi:flavodoxin [Prauserella marina]|nr:flavodoxin [Prauserella marina]